MNCKNTFKIGLIVACLFLSSCSFVRVQNVSESTITVSVYVPDAHRPYTKTIRSGDIAEFFSGHGGRYTVTTIASERYKATLESLREQITKRLFEERATLTAKDVSILTTNLNHLDKLYEEAHLPGASCSGHLADFDTSVAVVAFDRTSSQYELSCGSSY